MHYGVGGNTKFWGSVLYRLRREDFQEIAHADGVSPAWPIDYETLAPYYDRAEHLYHVHGDIGDDPDRAATPSVSARRSSACAWHGHHRRTAAQAGSAPLAIAPGPSQSRHAGRLHPLQHLQLISVQTAGEKRRRDLRRWRCDPPSERHAVDGRSCPAPADRRRRRACRGRRRRHAGRGRSRRGAAVRGLVWRGQLSRPATTLGQ